MYIQIIHELTYELSLRRLEVTTERHVNRGETMRQDVFDRWNRRVLKNEVEELNSFDGQRRTRWEGHDSGPLRGVRSFTR